MNPGVSLTDIANELGVSKMTVSLALRNNSRISSETRKKVKETADRMGYRPNPEVARFMAAIRHDKADERGMPLAYLTTGEPRGLWRESYTEALYWEGACERARQYGYYMEEYWMDEPNMTAKRMGDILWHRGIRGVIVPPFLRRLSRTAQELSLDMNWEPFATVAISDMLKKPFLNRVIHDHYTSMLTAMNALNELGYQRIGLCLEEHMDLTVNQRWQAGYRVYRARQDGARFEPLIVDQLDARCISEWVQANRIEAVIGADRRMPAFLQEAGINVGKDLAYADLDINLTDSNNKKISGIVQNSDRMGSAAVDLIIAGIQRDEHGVPDIPFVLQVEGSWVNRGSTPPRNGKKSKVKKQPKRTEN